MPKRTITYEDINSWESVEPFVPNSVHDLWCQLSDIRWAVDGVKYVLTSSYAKRWLSICKKIQKKAPNFYDVVNRYFWLDHA